ncbi:hypothetical protein PVK06_011921 [Gossypium arboreum]|uniref:DUF4219 domain-containing protein n=1 Tax=Gossypium arboreum TaxID=29729 RepID=A0ABR0QAJ1_GOSAR|nr:hypothetical protein PVK06_011921 [Gossypium arboreum]
MAFTSFSPPSSFIFNGENYHMWVVKMKIYLQAYELREVVNTDVELAPLRDNAIGVQIENMTKVKDKDEDEGFDDLFVKRIRPIVGTCHRFDLVVLKHTIFEEVARKNNIGVCCKMVKKECCKLAIDAVASSKMKCELVSSPKFKLRTQKSAS